MIKSFRYAFQGLVYASKERTFRIMCVIALMVIALALILKITLIEWSILILTMMVVFCFELLNTQVEKTLDILQPKRDARVRMIKDVSAGAVLIASIGSVFIGLLIFFPYLFFLVKRNILKNMNKKLLIIKYIIIILFGVLLFLIGTVVGDFTSEKEVIIHEVSDNSSYKPIISHEEAVMSVVEEVSPAVVSIIVSRDLPVIERRRYPSDLFDFFWFEERDIERRKVGGGTGFIISSDGLVLTNRHVVADLDAEFSVLTNDGRTFSAEVLIRDPIQDLAVLKIKEEGDFPTVRIGNSSDVRIGQTVIAIGNSLGEFRNTVSVGVVSGLGRSISATDGRTVQILMNVIQTDAAINRGNSGGPLLNLKGEVIGINTAMAIDAQNIGFSIPINKAERMIDSAIAGEDLVYPFLGVRYLMVDSSVKREYRLTVDHGALIVGDLNQPAIDPGSAAEKAGLMEGDVIIEFNGRIIDKDNHLAGVILNYNPGDEVEMKVIRDGREIIITAILGEKVW